MDTVTAEPVSAGYLSALGQLPLVSADSLLVGRHLVVVAPHPDDESLGVGGLIAMARHLDSVVTVVFLTDGEASHVDSPTFPPARLAQLRRIEALAALAELGVASNAANFLGLGDGTLSRLAEDARQQALERLQRCVPEGPGLVCVTADTDPHGDHQAAHRLVHEIAWGPEVIVMDFPVWTWLAAVEALPLQNPHGIRVDVSAAIAQKRRAVARHSSQHGLVVTDAAEAFVLDPEFVERFFSGTETLTWPT